MESRILCQYIYIRPTRWPKELDLHLLECPICLERLTQPKLLPCLHCFCQDCLGTYITKELSGKMASATSFPCPICRRMTPPVNQADTNGKWAEKFPTNGVIQDLIELTERSSEPLYCKPCQTKDNLTKSRCKAMNVSDQHDKKKVWYCENHCILGCSICIIKDHGRCEAVTTPMEYFQKLKAGSELTDMQAALKAGAEVMGLWVWVNKLQKDVTDELITRSEELKMNIETSLRQCERLMNRMLHTLKSSVTAVEENDNIETIMLYHRGQAEVESCKALVRELSESFTSVSIEHHIVSGPGTLGDDGMGKIVVRKQPRRVPGSLSYLAPPLSERRAKEIAKFNIKTSYDVADCCAYGVVYLPCDQIVVSDSGNLKLKLFTDKGQYLDELTIDSYPYDLCLVNNNSVAAAVFSSPVRVEVEDTKFSLLSRINMSNGEVCLGITHTGKSCVVGTLGGGVYSVTQDGVADLIHKYNTACYSLTHDPLKKDTLVSVYSSTPGDVAVSRLSANKRRTDVMKVGVMRGARGIDVDRDGNIYVCGYDSRNVVQMSGDGKHVRELLTSSDGMINPRAIAVHGDRFVVTNQSCTDEQNYLRVFQLY